MESSVSVNNLESQAPLVIILEYDLGLRQSLCDAMVPYPMRVLALESEREVLAKLNQASSAVVIIGSQLSSMSGFDLAKTIRRHYSGKTIEIILLTDGAWSATQKITAVKQLGLLALLHKPFNPKYIVDLVLQGITGFTSTHQLIDDGMLDWNLSGKAVAVVGENYPSSSEPEPVSGEISTATGTHFPVPTDPTTYSEPEMRGNFNTIPFPRLLRLLDYQTATGVLFLLQNSTKKIIYFKQGQPVFIKSNRLSECLGMVLMREGMITKAQYQESIRRMKETGHQQGKVLIEMGAITSRQLVLGLECQLQEKLKEIFSWTQGEFMFRNSEQVPTEPFVLNQNTTELIIDGIRANWDAQRCQETLASFLDHYIIPSSRPEIRYQELFLAEDERNFLDNINGEQTLREILSHALLPRPKAMITACLLLFTDVIEAQNLPQKQ